MPAFNLAQFRSLLLQDHVAKQRGESGIVFHPSRAFRKQIRLTNRTIDIRYRDAEAGHVVANEFCGDLNEALCSRSATGELR